MKSAVSLSLAAVLALGLVGAAAAQPTDNSEAGLRRHPVAGSDYWAYVEGHCNEPEWRAGLRACASPIR